MKYYYFLFLSFLFTFLSCNQSSNNTQNTSEEIIETLPAPDFLWENATVYFLLTDRFNNGNTENDLNFDRKKDGAVLRSFEGGDLQGITQKIQDGYFDKLGVNAIWFTPPVEQIHSFTDEGTGKTYGYHGYWARDWTNLDPNFGTMANFKELVDTAHEHGIRILMDVVINHTGPVTPTDTQYPDEWVRTSPKCEFQDAKTTVECTLVENLPDIYTESDEAVELPQFLVDKWKEEGRYKQEVQELEQFFAETGYPKSPRHYIMKWLTDYVRELGIDGFRVDTAKHTEGYVWGELKKVAVKAFQDWKAANPSKILDDNEFFMTGEVYNYAIQHGKDFDMGQGEMVNFYDHGFKSLINFAFKGDATKDPESVFKAYSDILNNGALKGYSVLNYLSSHDDGSPYDPERQQAMKAGTLLLLAPGSAQIYYGDELARPLKVEGADGDAHLRSFMNWDELAQGGNRNGVAISDILAHWQKLGQFRKEHVSVGAGVHNKLQDSPYIFKREYKGEGTEDKVIVAMDLPSGASQTIQVFDTFQEGETLKDYYSGAIAKVENGSITFSTNGNILLVGRGK